MNGDSIVELVHFWDHGRQEAIWRERSGSFSTYITHDCTDIKNYSGRGLAQPLQNLSRTLRISASSFSLTYDQATCKIGYGRFFLFGLRQDEIALQGMGEVGNLVLAV